MLPITNYAQCEPLLTKTTDGSVQVYFTMNAEPGGIYSVFVITKDAKVNSIFEPTDKNEINYCMRNIYADEMVRCIIVMMQDMFLQLVKKQQEL
mgnify:CR=1 FL=1